MTFLNSPMLAGLAAALLPLVIHLLNRSRYRNVDWAAMMFLDAMEPRADHTARLKQWGLLAMRCGGLGVVGFALARAGRARTRRATRCTNSSRRVSSGATICGCCRWGTATRPRRRPTARTRRRW